MDVTDAIKYHGIINSRNCHPKRLENIYSNLPYFEIFKNDLNKYDIKSYNYEREDNAPRMPYIENYIKANILPNVDKEVDLRGFYNIELHDACTYRSHVTNQEYKDVLTFAKYKDDKEPVLIPDIYQMGNYGNTLNFNDPYSWDQKESRVIFRGSTTGPRDPHLNPRIQIAIWALTRPELYDIKLTNIVQMNPNHVYGELPILPQLISSPSPIDQQLKYKYHLNLDGNTCRFDVWPYKTNGIVLKYSSTEMLWYYPMMLDKYHFVNVDKNNMEAAMNYYNNNPLEAQIISVNARRFIHDFCSSSAHQVYTVSLFESIGANK